MAIEAKTSEVVVADPYPIVRYGLIRMFRDNDNLKVIAEASDGEETVRLCSELKPDLLVLVEYPGFNLRMANWASKHG